MKHTPVFEWEDPGPKAHRGPGRRYSEVVAQLQAQPGRWAVVARTVSPTGAGPVSTFRRYGCEVTQRTDPDGTFRIYARWPEDGAS